MHNFTFPLAARGSRREGQPLAVYREVNKVIGYLRMAKSIFMTRDQSFFLVKCEMAKINPHNYVFCI